MLQMNYSVPPPRNNNPLLANLLCRWFMLNCLKRDYPRVDPILAEIYFQTYGINTLGISKESFKELMTEYNDAIISFFLSCQRQRCLEIIDFIRDYVLGDNGSKIANMMIAVPAQCKPFFKEVLVLDRESKTYNVFTKETQCLDSLRDTLVANSASMQRYSQYSRKAYTRATNTSNTVGSMCYIVSPGEFSAFINIVREAVIGLYRPLFNLESDRGVKNSRFFKKEIYEDSGTRFSKIIDYIKTLIYILCTSIDEDRITIGPDWYWATSLPYAMHDAFETVLKEVKDSYTCPYMIEIRKALSIYGGLHINHAICLPTNTTVNLADRFTFSKSTNTRAYEFLCCQEFIECMKATAARKDRNPQPEGGEGGLDVVCGGNI